MVAIMRSCAGRKDFPAISDFLYTLYQPENRDGNWFQPIWEYAYTHSLFDEDAVNRIGIWEDGDAIVAVVVYEWALGEAFFQVHPDYEYLKPEMLDHAESQLTGVDDNGVRYLKAYVNDFDAAFEEVVRSRGYALRPDSHRPMSQFAIPDPFPPIRLPDGYRLLSLADDNDLPKVDRALWRGFNHPGEPPADGIEWPCENAVGTALSQRPDHRDRSAQRRLRKLRRPVVRTGQRLRLRGAGGHGPGLPAHGAGHGCRAGGHSPLR